MSCTSQCDSTVVRSGSYRQLFRRDAVEDHRQIIAEWVLLSSTVVVCRPDRTGHKTTRISPRWEITDVRGCEHRPRVKVCAIESAALHGQDDAIAPSHWNDWGQRQVNWVCLINDTEAPQIPSVGL